jgi:hypothetical protein
VKATVKRIGRYIWAWWFPIFFVIDCAVALIFNDRFWLYMALAPLVGCAIKAFDYVNNQKENEE